MKNIKEDAKEITRATADAEKISKFIMAFERDKELDKLLDIEPKEIVTEPRKTGVFFHAASCHFEFLSNLSLSPS